MTTAGPATLHLPVNTLALRRGGLVKAVMIRANALAAAVPQRAVVVEVLAFQPRIEEDIADLVERGYLDPRVHVRSILRCFDPSLPPPTSADPIRGCVHHAGVRPTSITTPTADPRAVVIDTPTTDELVRRIGSRELERVPAFDELKRLRWTDTVTAAGHRVRREEHGAHDRVVRVLDHEPGAAQPSVQRWIGADGRCFLTVWQDPSTRDWAQAFAVVDGQVRAFADPRATYRAVFEHALRTERDPVLFSEFRDRLPNLPGGGFDEVVTDVEHPTLRRVAVMHSNHAAGVPKALPIKSSPNFAALLSGLDSWDLLVTATEQQRSEIVAQHGHDEIVTAIPHHAPDVRPHTDVATDPDRFVLVARIHRKKRVDEAVEVFRLVVDANPAAHLDVYGFGYGDELEHTVKSLVVDLGLSEHLAFKGFVDDTADIYAGACATLQTSQSEGFGMALVESLAHGVPVVAYDVRYGARDAVRDDVDGYVVPWGDRRAMADRLIAIGCDPQLRARLAEQAPFGAARFSRERYTREWIKALDALPVREAPPQPPRVSVTRGRLNLTYPDGDAGVIVVRRRDRSGTVEAALQGGAAELELPESKTGVILDISLRVADKEKRVPFSAATMTGDHAWQAFGTEYGNVSLKRQAEARPTVRPASQAAPPHFAKRVIRKLRSGR